jgi:hypothetical protein
MDLFLSSIIIDKLLKLFDKDSNKSFFQSITSDCNENSNFHSKKISFPIEIRNEIYSRVISFFGDEKFDRIQNAFIIVVGLGGVGSHAANMLVRSGIQHIRLIDFDQVSLSSLNR